MFLPVQFLDGFHGGKEEETGDLYSSTVSLHDWEELAQAEKG